MSNAQEGLEFCQVVITLFREKRVFSIVCTALHCCPQATECREWLVAYRPRGHITGLCFWSQRALGCGGGGRRE